MPIKTGWWFGTCFIFPYIGNNHPNWPIFFRGVQTTNQKMLIQWLTGTWGTTHSHAMIGGEWSQSPGEKLFATIWRSVQASEGAVGRWWEPWLSIFFVEIPHTNSLYLPYLFHVFFPMKSWGSLRSASRCSTPAFGHCYAAAQKCCGFASVDRREPQKTRHREPVDVEQERGCPQMLFCCIFEGRRESEVLYEINLFVVKNWTVYNEGILKTAFSSHAPLVLEVVNICDKNRWRSLSFNALAKPS